MEKDVDWIIHKVWDDGFLEHTCNAHTHGLWEKYNHLDFQLVLNFPDKDISAILNTFGLRVQAGEKFHDGQMVSGIFSDCDVRLEMCEETERIVLRIVVPDGKNRFPEDEGCDLPYALQDLETYELCVDDDDEEDK